MSRQIYEPTGRERDGSDPDPVFPYCHPSMSMTIDKLGCDEIGKTLLHAH